MGRGVLEHRLDERRPRFVERPARDLMLARSTMCGWHERQHLDLHARQMRPARTSRLAPSPQRRRR